MEDKMEGKSSSGKLYSPEFTFDIDMWNIQLILVSSSWRSYVLLSLWKTENFETVYVFHTFTEAWHIYKLIYWKRKLSPHMFISLLNIFCHSHLQLVYVLLIDYKTKLTIFLENRFLFPLVCPFTRRGYHFGSWHHLFTLCAFVSSPVSKSRWRHLAVAT